MDFTKKEVELISKTVELASKESMVELQDLELALVGGGIGDTIPH